jgi:Domain of unknown function (DUF892)
MFGKIKSLRELFEIELGYAYDCEKKLVEKGLPGMIESASSSELRSALEQHLQKTRGHVTRLVRVFATLGVEPKAARLIPRLIDPLDWLDTQGAAMACDFPAPPSMPRAPDF